MAFRFWITRSIVGPRWLMMTPLACATACGMGTGPAPISSSGSLGRIAESGTLGGAGIGRDIRVVSWPLPNAWCGRMDGIEARRRRDVAAAALVTGVLGLAVGAAH